MTELSYIHPWPDEFPAPFGSHYPDSFGKSTSVGASLLVYDTFTGANGTALTAHTPDIAPVGSAWDNANVEIQGNLATLKAANTRQKSIIESSVSDCVITASISYGGTTTSALITFACGIVFRYTDVNNFWISSYVPRVDNTGFIIWEMQAGVPTIRANMIPNPVGVSGVPYSHKVTLNGPSIIAEANGNLLTYSSAFNQNRTKHGFMLSFSNVESPAQAICDDFIVSSL